MTAARGISYPINQDWVRTGIKGERYELYKNSDGLLALFLDGKMLPFQKDLSYHQKMDDAITLEIKLLLG